MNPKENDNEIIELTDEELDEIFADDDFDNGEEDGKIRSFHFSNPDPYAKVKPRPDDAPKREFSFDEKGNIVVKNPSAFWLPDVKIVEEHGGTEYTVTGSYEGTETLDKNSDALWSRTLPMIKVVSRRTPMSNDVSLDINQKSNPVQAVAPPKEDNNMLRATDKITALYCRLSVEDTKEKGGKDDPSNSIQHQQVMLMEYAKSQHFPNPTFFIDDGYSGVDFSNRPGFQKMLAEIEAGHVEVVITKDLSRLGRNSSLTGLYINYTFPQYGVRYIAINDHFDTIDPNSTDSDMAGIKNWFNEWYSKDTSRKIRAVNKAKGERGERLTTNVPYGYKRDPDDPKKWVIDEEAAQVVKRIFALCMEGKGPSQIAALLEKERVLNPTAYKQREGRKTPHQTPENEYRWHESTVAYILEYMEYTGCTVNFKTYTNSIWDKKQRENPIENRKIFYNTHPAIISLEVFDKVQEIRQQRHRRTATGKSNMFSGLVFCNDCKQKLYYSTTSYFEKRQDFFICSTHRANKDKCSGHYIRAVVLEQIVWKHIQEVVSVVTRYEAYFRSEMEQKLRVQSEETMRLCRKRLAQAEKRMGELDRLFVRIYEDNVAGKLDDERFAMMSKNYTEEQKNLKAEVKGLQQQIHEQEQQAENIEQFVQRVKRNSTLTELTPYALRELVKAVYVDAPDKSSGKRRQKVHIEYDLVGYIPVDELLKAEQA